MSHRSQRLIRDRCLEGAGTHLWCSGLLPSPPPRTPDNSTPVQGVSARDATCERIESTCRGPATQVLYATYETQHACEPDKFAQTSLTLTFKEVDSNSLRKKCTSLHWGPLGLQYGGTWLSSVFTGNHTTRKSAAPLKVAAVELEDMDFIKDSPNRYIELNMSTYIELRNHSD